MKTILAFLTLTLLASAAEEGFIPLFDGKTLEGWTLVQKSKSGRGYIVENGLLVCPKDGGGNLLTEREFSDFVFRFDFRMEPGGNNGVGIRAPLAGDIAYSGMEIQILDHNHEKYREWLKPTQRHGAVYDLIPPIAEALKPAGEWNSEEIHVQGRRVRVTLNGVLITDADLATITDPAALKKHPGAARTSGHIGFLGHGSLIEFRNIRVKPL
ncbi:MAG: DUF1080 domain-containing protein [Acidobacteria bacterium]|nr:DUF1080 domain-containing protein [Acidobacteriota bacterium]